MIAQVRSTQVARPLSAFVVTYNLPCSVPAQITCELLEVLLNGPPAASAAM